jgi:acyl carrier protein
MTEQDVLSAIAEIIADKFEYAGPITADTVAGDVEGWDSVAQVELIIEVERHFGIRFTTGEVAGLPNVGALVATVQRHRQRKGS